MPSPFPGVDPYIEVCHLWEDFHLGLISEIKNQIAAILPNRYVVRTGQRTYVTLTAPNGVDEYRMQADVSVAAKRDIGSPSGQPGATALLESTDAASAPITMRAMAKTEFREAFLEIREVHPDRQLVTTLEILSPSNKRFGSEGWFEYLRKRQTCLGGMFNFVEIDLLRGGRRMPMDDDWPVSPYYLLVCRKDQAPRCTVWPASFLHPLPVIPIPLLPPDADIALSIQPLIAAIYASSHYELDIDYHQGLRPPFSAAEAAWLEERLRQQQTST